MDHPAAIADAAVLLPPMQRAASVFFPPQAAGEGSENRSCQVA